MRWALTLLLLSFLASCGAEEEGGGTPPDRFDARCAPDTQDWFIECPESLQVAPAQRVPLLVDRMELDAPDVYLWIEGDDEPHVLRATGPAPDEGDDRKRVNFPFPKIEEGTYRVSLGDMVESRSNVIELEVVYPERRFTQEEVAVLIDDGLSTLAGELRALMNGERSEDWAAVVTEAYTPEMFEVVMTQFTVADGVVDQLADDYRALDPEVEALAQASLDGSGFLNQLEVLAALPEFTVPKASGYYIGGTAIWLDATSTVLDGLGIVLDVVVVAGVLATASPLAPLAAAVAGIGTTAKVALAVIKLIVDSFIPTDLVRLEAQTPELVIAPWSGLTLLWGTFRPQNNAGGTIRSAGDIVAAAIPGGSATNPLRQAAQEFLIGTLTRLGFSATYYFDTLESFPFERLQIKALVDPRAYNLSLNALAVRLGPVGRLLSEAFWFLNSFSLRDSVRIEVAQPQEWFENAQVFMFAEYIIEFEDVAFPGNDPLQEAAVTLTYDGFRFETRSALGISFPTWEMVSTTASRPVFVRAGEDLMSFPNDNRERNPILFAHTTGPAPFLVYSPITPVTTTNRTQEVLIWQRNGLTLGATVKVSVNGVLLGEVEPELWFTGGEPTPVISVPFVPGRNELQISLGSGELLDCSISTLRARGSGCLIVRFPEALTFVREHPIFLGETPDGVYTFEVYTPPSF